MSINEAGFTPDCILQLFYHSGPVVGAGKSKLLTDVHLVIAVRILPA
jgi:hypothetical protein